MNRPIDACTEFKIVTVTPAVGVAQMHHLRRHNRGGSVIICCKGGRTNSSVTVCLFRGDHSACKECFGWLRKFAQKKSTHDLFLPINVKHETYYYTMTYCSHQGALTS